MYKIPSHLWLSRFLGTRIRVGWESDSMGWAVQTVHSSWPCKIETCHLALNLPKPNNNTKSTGKDEAHPNKPTPNQSNPQMNDAELPQTNFMGKPVSPGSTKQNICGHEPFCSCTNHGSSAVNCASLACSVSPYIAD